MYYGAVMSVVQPDTPPSKPLVFFVVDEALIVAEPSIEMQGGYRRQLSEMSKLEERFDRYCKIKPKAVKQSSFTRHLGKEPVTITTIFTRNIKRAVLAKRTVVVWSLTIHGERTVEYQGLKHTMVQLADLLAPSLGNRLER